MPKHPFVAVVVGEEQLEDIENLRQAFTAVYDILLAVCPVGRERAVAVTNLETAGMWATRSIVTAEVEDFHAPTVVSKR